MSDTMSCNNGYVTDGSKWSARQVEVNISSHTWPTIWQDTARAAMDRWNQVGANFTFVEDENAADGLSAHYRDYDRGRKATTRLTPSGPNSSLRSFDIEVNIYFAYNPAHPNQHEAGIGTKLDLESIVAHEFGHVLHLDHLKDPSDAAELMYFDVGTALKPLGPGDRHGILSLYP